MWSGLTPGKTHLGAIWGCLHPRTHGKGFLFHSRTLLSSASWPLWRASPPLSPMTGCTLKQSIFSSHVPRRAKWTLPDGSITSPVTYKDDRAEIWSIAFTVLLSWGFWYRKTLGEILVTYLQWQATESAYIALCVCNEEERLRFRVTLSNAQGLAIPGSEISRSMPYMALWTWGPHLDWPPARQS